VDSIGSAGTAELGRYLIQVRERAGIKQAELARKTSWSAAVLSRIETGDRALAKDELQTILEAIGTQEALHLLEIIDRDWSIIPRPPLDDPDQDLLWSAEEVAKQLAELCERPDISHAFERRLSEYIAEIRNVAGLLLKREHQLAFIGSIGVGKSSAICRLTGLEIPPQDGGPPVPVLEIGAGGVTFCEVYLRIGPSYGLLIEPSTEGEIRANVTDFAEHILRGDLLAESAYAQGTDEEPQGISKEIERAVRNMAGLKIRREKASDGKVVRSDEAKELAKQFRSVKEMAVEVLARMELHRRDRRDIWYDTSCGKAPLVWLKEIFELVNNGRHPEFTFPKRIELIAPLQPLGAPWLSVPIIDTKGIDRTVARPDLEHYLDDPHTLVVLCSAFNNAPAAESRLLIERAKEAGIPHLDLNACFLILPRPNEALAVKDESGIRVGSTEEGYDLKGEQVLMALESLGPYRFSVGFYNAFQDEPDQLREFLVGQLGRVRQSFRDRLQLIITNAESLLLNHEREEVQAVLRSAAGMFKSWITQNNSVLTKDVHVQDSLMGQMTNVHPATVHAAVRREGEWLNLSYLHHLGYGARRIAALSLDEMVNGFSKLCKTLMGNPDFEKAGDLIQQAERVLRNSYEELLRKLQLMGQTSFRDELKSDRIYWDDCEKEWGQGPGYRNRIVDRSATWFREEKRTEIEEELRLFIRREWSQALERVAALFENEQ
jgi:transcriptional regulator with XRE-family HTH domain